MSDQNAHVNLCENLASFSNRELAFEEKYIYENDNEYVSEVSHTGTGTASWADTLSKQSFKLNRHNSTFVYYYIDQDLNESTSTHEYKIVDMELRLRCLERTSTFNHYKEKRSYIFDNKVAELDIRKWYDTEEAELKISDLHTQTEWTNQDDDRCGYGDDHFILYRNRDILGDQKVKEYLSCEYRKINDEYQSILRDIINICGNEIYDELVKSKSDSLFAKKIPEQTFRVLDDFLSYGDSYHYKMSLKEFRNYQNLLDRLDRYKLGQSKCIFRKR